jgi:hypothetical protein
MLFAARVESARIDMNERACAGDVVASQAAVHARHMIFINDKHLGRVKCA